MTREPSPSAWLVDTEDDFPHATIEREDAERDAEHARAHTGKPTHVVPLYTVEEMARALEEEAERMMANGLVAKDGYADGIVLAAAARFLRSLRRGQP